MKHYNFKKDKEVLDKVEEWVSENLDKEAYTNIELYMFPQMWCSTAGGIGTTGGQAFTTYTTVVLIERYSNKAYVFHNNGIFAYQVEFSKKFYEDLKKYELAHKSNKDKYDMGD